MEELRRVDPIDRAHLTGATRPSPPIYRYAPAPELADLVERYWLPVWSLTEPSSQSTLQHPVCLIVVSNTYARFYGVVRGLSTVTLEGEGWAVGVMFRPAAGRLLLGRSVTVVADSYLDLTELDSLDGAALTAELRAAMTPDPHGEGGHRRAIAAYEARLRSLLPVDEQGQLINEVIDWLHHHPAVTRVADVAAAFGLSERALQRLVESRVGLTPKWLIQRRRLHDAVEQLKKGGGPTLADLAVELGYADQAHFTHDFRAVTGITPGSYLADQSSAE
ncbi:MAG: helix-turn-helix domain-containing protein [Nocardioides sp.]|uniref:AraC family transcriptional regulator n=1 Tax=Nocardioides sp. TaxID=35761 RepID=UPI0039E57373